MECLDSNTLDNMYITMLLLGLAVGIMIGAVIVDSIHKSRRDLP